MTHDETGSIELWLTVVRHIIGAPTQDLSLLDLCCNECTGTRQLGFKTHFGVDVEDCPLRPKEVRFLQLDVLDYLWTHSANASFDVCICSDGIEHLTPNDGNLLLRDMNNVADLAIIFTPLGPYMVEPLNPSPHAHKSAWLPADLENLGWTTEVYPNWHPTLGVGAFFAWKGKLTL